jgi:dipeptidyl-peptidase 4
MQLKILFFLFWGFTLLGQQKLTVETIYKGTFREKQLDQMQVLKNTKQYSLLNYQDNYTSVSIDLYDFETQKKLKTIFNSQQFADIGMPESYVFDDANSQILMAYNSTPIYRHSFLANYYLYDIAKKTIQAVSENPIQEATLSPDGSKIAYALQNNLFVFDVSSKTTMQVTADGKKNKIINGITDWVYEEEFAFVRAFDWSADSKNLAYIQFNETDVPEFSMVMYEDNLYPRIETFKYPKAGEKNSKVRLFLYELEPKKTQEVDLSGYTDFYIPRIFWTKDANILSAKIVNRHQNNLDLLFIDAKTAKSKVILTEKNKTYIDYLDKDNLYFLSDNSFVMHNETDGYNHLYWYDSNGKLVNQITKGKWEVTDFYGFNEKTRTLFYQSTENGTTNRAIYSIGIDGKNKRCLTTNIGKHEVHFSADFDFYIDTFSSITEPTSYTLYATKSGKALQIVVNNDDLKQISDRFELPAKTLFTINVNGNELNAWMLKPTDFDPSKKYPLLLYQYSGPGSQEVANEWNNTNDYWFKMLTQKGYVVACVDGRGTGYKGAEFKKTTYKELGKYEVEDQIAAATLFSKYNYIDASRIGIFGWSYGGFMAANCILKGADIFKTAVAVAPVTNWRFYDSVYTERYMRTPQENPTGYDHNSPINHVQKLKGNLLLIHGSGDDNVHVQNSMLMMKALIQANKQFDSQIYPDNNHGIYGGYTRIQLFNKITDYIINKL